MKRYRARRARHQEAAELNVTAFMNLMVVLVPFLLILAVFSRVTIHELNLPGEASADAERPPLELEIVLRQDAIVLSERSRGTLGEIANVDGGYDLATLGDWLQRLKAETPDADQATIRLEPQVDYQSLISVMDTVRGGSGATTALFPHVSIGDAPPQGGPEA